MFYPDLEQVKILAKDYNIIPVTMEFYADMETPISLFKRFEDSKYCFLLESVEGGEKWARYSFVGRNPFEVVKSFGNKTFISDKDGNTKEVFGNPIDILKEKLEAYKGASLPEVPRFNGGAVGFFGYDIVRFCENLPNVPKDEVNLPDSHFMFVDELLVFDHLKQKINIIVNLMVKDNIERAYNTAIERIKNIYKEIITTRYKAVNNINLSLIQEKKKLSFESNMTMEEYCEKVLKAKEYIKNGDIFQVVLSQKMHIETEIEPLNVYRALRVINPSPYMYYLKFDDYKIVGASPEMLVRAENGKVETCPIAGTRKRGKSLEEDELLQKELLNDPKEIAEHTMLVDLGRNDIGKISKFGTVKVRDMMHIEKFSHVIHLVTNVEGQMKDGKTAFDALKALLPAGTLSGAPKIRAMQIIDELEPTKRGPYGGAIGYFSFDGNLDSCITIRTMIFKGKNAYLQAGAGIVADSVPENEYHETISKAMALMKAIEEAGVIR